MSECQYFEVNPTRNVSGSSFPLGVMEFPFSVGVPNVWCPSKSYFRVGMTIYGSGGGVTSPLGMTGGVWPITTSLPTLTLPVSVSIGSTNAIPLYAGSAPTLESGYFQINVTLPSGLQASTADLVATIGGSSSAAVPIYIQ